MRTLITSLSLAGLLALSGAAAYAQNYHFTPRSGGYSGYSHSQVERRAYYGRTTPYSQYNAYRSPYGAYGSPYSGYSSPYQGYGPSIGYGSPRYYSAPYGSSYSRGYSAWDQPSNSYSSPSRGYSSFSFSW